MIYNNNNTFIPIQIIGTQRSGSNLLRLILNQSPLISAHHPPHILNVFHPILHKYGDLNLNDNFSRLVNDVCRLVEVNPVKWDLNLNRNEIIKCCTQPTLIEIFKVIYEMMAQKDKAIYWCCKSMANVNYYSDIENNGLKPYYIHLIRDGRDVASSFKKTLVGEKHTYHLAEIWKTDFLKAKEVYHNVGKDRYLPIKYESLISDPMKVLQEINTFLDLSLDKSALHYFDSNESKRTAEAGFMWSNLTQPIMKNNTGKFLENLTKEDIEIFERVAGDILQENGYKLCSTHNKKEFTQEEIQNFDDLNLKLKTAAQNSKHLKVDRECRVKRKELINELTTILTL
ncbi:sulfotransferase family protein [Flavivirga spongiicola]|uniref:Sulfotransferase n=1 Tax=Flavivirga spongiicola TaxID=421621 RepID=A0ABU7XQ33_9FLAO|nr:sulfotransferase [Flavivirga sp. MEBiC05379]MDO5977871.1 sulfotransferase [Flavivirga sp. MEBiC05379]